MTLPFFLHRLWKRSPPPITHTLICGASRSGKSEAELARLLPLAKRDSCAIVLLDPPGTLAAKFLLHLDAAGLTERVLYDRLADTDRVPGYDWLSSSKHPDPLQREGENDERIREFASILLRRRRMQDAAMAPLTEEWLLAALRLWIYQKTPVPLSSLADCFGGRSPEYLHLLGSCTDAAIVEKFRTLASLSPTARRNETAPAERILRAVCESPSFRIRAGDATFDFGQFLDEKGILLLDGSSRGNLSRDAATVMMGAVILRVISHCRTGARSRIVLALDEAVNAGLIGLHESQALSEAGKWGLEFHILIQDPFNFPSSDIRSNVLQSTWRHEWFRQGSPEAARLAAEDLAIPLLNPLQHHHTEYRARSVDAGFERVQTQSESESFDKHGFSRGRTASWRTVLWPRRRDVREAQEHYTTLQDQILLMQKDLMLLKPGYRFVRADTVTPRSVYVPMLRFPRGMHSVPDTPASKSIPTIAEREIERVLQTLKQGVEYRTPAAPEKTDPSSTSPSAGAASKLREGI